MKTRTLLSAMFFACLVLGPLAGRGNWQASAASTTAGAAVSNKLLAATSRDAAGTLTSLAAGTALRESVAASGISLDLLRLAVSATTCAVQSGDIPSPPTLTVIDYSRPSTEERLWVFDLRSGRLLFKELVAHGRNTGDNMAVRFSDDMNSRQSSLGLFVTADTYEGSNGYSLRLDGLEPGFNGRARERAIVMHGAPYVDAALATAQGRIGRSWGCPALRAAIAHDVIDTIRNGGVIFSFYPDQNWLDTSRLLHCNDAAPDVIATR